VDDIFAESCGNVVVTFLMTGILTSQVFRGHHRKVRLLFGISDILLTALAFLLAYRTRVLLDHVPLEHDFHLAAPVQVLLLGGSMIVWVAIGTWWQIYDRIDAAHPRIILRDTFRQCLLGAVAIVLFEFALRLDLSRSFLAMFAGFNWALLCVFRLNAGSILGMMRREFGVPSYVMVVGLGEARYASGRQIEERALRHPAQRISIGPGERDCGGRSHTRASVSGAAAHEAA
jgi:hypothetical protein